jgi:hypothetical protein
MARNPHKTRCLVPGCRNWAMRGHTRCRPHRDAELGPRGAGAPPGNLNALRTGENAHPLSPDDLGQLAQSILRTPDQLPHHLDRTIQSIHRRYRDPVKTLLALQALVPVLLSRVADDLFVAELHALRQQLPPAHQGQVELAIWRRAVPLSPIHKLELLRKLQRATSAQGAQPSAEAATPDPPRAVPGRDGPDGPQGRDPDIEPEKRMPMEKQLPVSTGRLTFASGGA